MTDPAAPVKSRRLSPLFALLLVVAGFAIASVCYVVVFVPRG